MELSKSVDDHKQSKTKNQDRNDVTTAFKPVDQEQSRQIIMTFY